MSDKNLSDKFMAAVLIDKDNRILENLTKSARCERWTAAVEITVDGVLQTEQNNDLPQPLDVRSDRIYPINV